MNFYREGAITQEEFSLKKHRITDYRNLWNGNCRKKVTLRRAFQHQLVQVKNKQFFGVVQKINFYYKDKFLTALFIGLFVDPYFTLFPEKEFNDYVKFAEADINIEEKVKQRIFRIKACEKIITFQIHIQAESSLPLKNQYIKPKILTFWETILLTCPSNTLEEAISKINTSLYNEFFFSGQQIAEKFIIAVSEKKSLYEIDKSLVNHISPEKNIELSSFFSEENMYELLRKIPEIEREPIWDNREFITTYAAYKELLLDFYGEEGNCCKYTNFNERLLENNETIEDLMCIVLGEGVIAEKRVGLAGYKSYPFGKSAIESHWFTWKKFGENLSKILL